MSMKKHDKKAAVTIIQLWASESNSLARLSDFLPGAAVALGPLEYATPAWPAYQKAYIQAGKSATANALRRIFEPIYGGRNWKDAVLFDFEIELKMLTATEQAALFSQHEVVCPYRRFDGYHETLKESAQEFTRRVQVSGPVNLRFFRLAKGEYARCGVAFMGLKDESGMSVSCIFFRGSTYWRGSVEIFKVYREYEQLTKPQFRTLRGRSGVGRAVA